MIILFHITTIENAATILRDGFVDGRRKYMIDIELNGVFLSDRPLEDEGEIAEPIVLAVTFDLLSSELVDFELVEGKPYREWCVPAEIIRTKAIVAIG